MRSRSYFWRVAIGATALVAFGVVLFLAVVAEARHQAELRLFRGVQLNMAEEEVLAAMGKAPGHYGPWGATYAEPSPFL